LNPTRETLANASPSLCVGQRLVVCALSPSRHACDQGRYEQDNEHPEQKPGGFHGEARDAAESNRCRNERDDQKHQRVVKQITHDPISIACAAPSGAGEVSRAKRALLHGGSGKREISLGFGETAFAAAAF
jgi:hypothetical protein